MCTPCAAASPSISRTTSSIGSITDTGSLTPLKSFGHWPKSIPFRLRTARSSTTRYFDQEFDDEKDKWQSFGPDDDFKTSVVPPIKKQLEGYDVVTFSVHTSPECSPLSCNSLAMIVATNRHCLFNSFDEARARIEKGSFENSEPGPFRIFAVYSIDEA